MVKGNWERRVELTNKRRQLAKEKTISDYSNGDSAIAKLLNFAETDLECGHVEVYLPAGRIVCSRWLRSGDCILKKCRHSHEVDNSLSRLRGLMPFDEENDGESEEAGFAVPLIDVLPRDRNSTLFIAVDGACVYDKRHAHIWKNWLEARSPSLKALSVIQEGKEEEENLFRLKTRVGVTPDDEGVVVKEMSSLSSTRPLILQELSKFLLGEVFSWLTIGDFLSLLMTSREVNSIVLRDPMVRERRGRSRSLALREALRKEGEEKKKKAKQAHCKKTNKKDAFARGGCSGQR